MESSPVPPSSLAPSPSSSSPASSSSPPSAATGSPPPALELIGVTRRLPSGDRTLTILDRVDLAVAPGEFVAVLGPSGSGKSTLLGLAAGLDRPSEGRVLVAGREIQDLSEDELARLRRRSVGFVFQTFELLDNMTARENVLLPLELAGAAGARERADELLAEVGLGERGHHYPSQLSGGERQRVALARAFAASPALLLADEPTGNLDSATGARVLDVLDDLRRRRGVTLVLVTHDPAVAERADRRVHLADGRVARIEGGDGLRSGDGLQGDDGPRTGDAGATP